MGCANQTTLKGTLNPADDLHGPLPCFFATVLMRGALFWTRGNHLTLSAIAGSGLHDLPQNKDAVREI